MDKENPDPAEAMKEQIAYSLNVLGFPKRVTPIEVSDMVNNENGFSIEYAECISWLSTELKTQCGLEECIQPMSEPDDEESFRTEFSIFLRELKCPYPSFSDQSSSQDYSKAFHHLELLAYLCTELQAARISKRVKREGSVSLEKPSLKCQLETTAEALGISEKIFDADSALKVLRFIFEKLKNCMVEVQGAIGEPLFTDELTREQWTEMESLNEQLKVDYRIRAQMLLQRLDVTIQSFSWSDRLKARKPEILAIYNPLRNQLTTHSRVEISDLLAARNDLTFVERASSSNLALTSKLQKLMLVVRPPDRGGRPKDVTRMPQWRERVVEGGGGPARERGRKKKGGKEKRKPWKDEEAKAGPSGSVSMTKKSRKKQKRGSDAEGTEVQDASQL